MNLDLHGLPLTAPSAAAAAAFNETCRRYLTYRADTVQPLFATLAAEPGFVMGQCLKGYLLLLACKQAMVPIAAGALAQAREAAAAASGATARERMHLAALQAWVDGHLERALALWDQISREHPTDLLAFRLAHFHLFWLGRPQAMLASVEQARPHWHEGLAGWGSMLACHCFALEECGRLDQAEPLGRAAVALDPQDIWGTHAVAHVLEMQGRHTEGLAWLTQQSGHWAEGNNLVHHLWWHAALMHLGEGDTQTALSLYDTRFRNLSAPLTQAQPDLYIDLQNAISMLYRLEHLGVPAGPRWRELADHAQARVGDCLSAFSLPHYMLALLADGRDAAAQQLLAGMHGFGQGSDDQAEVVREVALPLCAAMREAAGGDMAGALGRLGPVLPRLPELGGSHAQQELLTLFCWRTARAAGASAEADRQREAAGRHFIGGWRARAVFRVH